MITPEQLHAAGLIGELDLHFARTLARLSGERDGRVLAAAALASRHVQAGHVCLELPGLSLSQLAADGSACVDVELPPLRWWQRAIAESPLCGGPDDSAPLYLDAAGRLYLRRYHEHERALSAAISRRIERGPVGRGAGARARLEAGLDRLFPARPSQGGPDLQREAARMAVERPFCVVSGGPGTGKTSTVVKILALLVEDELGAGRSAPRILLVAPTGKAAARLSESIARSKSGLECAPEVLAAITEEASTIHRALGTVAGRPGRFRHHREAPLAADVIIVDEASMVDLALMTRLFDALPDGARVILLGDKNQLASVEAGAVLGDICGAGLADTSRATPNVPPIAGAIVHLTHSYRYGQDSGIGRLAEAINAADADAALAVLDDAHFPDVTRMPPAEGETVPVVLVAAAVEGFRPCFEADEPAERLRALERHRVLCAHRRGPEGLIAINERIEQRLRDLGLVRIEGSRYPGRPILVTQNDYQVQLFNGDVGVLDRQPDPGGGAPRVQAHFLGARGEPRAIAAARLPPHESVFAMSVHKSQGSEFDRVDVLLPREPSPILSRELLYTAVTRARRRVVIHGSEAVVRLAIDSAVERASGLRDALWGRMP
ncbi:MAG: exodeoxyribonuclease V subunit alpha [Myxococcales bacterium]